MPAFRPSNSTQPSITNEGSPTANTPQGTTIRVALPLGHFASPQRPSTQQASPPPGVNTPLHVASTPEATLTIDAKQSIASVRRSPLFQAIEPTSELPFALDESGDIALLVDTVEEELELDDTPSPLETSASSPFLLVGNTASTEQKQKRRERDQAALLLWDQFMEHPTDKRLRDKLAVHYLYLIKQTVARLPVVLPPSICQEDLMSFGTIGLLEAIKRFEPRRGFKFESFAMSRIRGEIIDQLRRHDWVPRGVRRRTKVLMQTIQEMEQTLGRHPLPEEVAAKLNLPVAKVNALLNEASTLVVSLDEHAYEDKEGGGMSVIDTVADTSAASDPLMQIMEGNDRQRLAKAINALPEREKLIIALYYQENMTLREIGDIISVSESRACQLHAQAIYRLRQLLRGSA